jgi:cytoskeletal protein RodZ
MNDSSIISPSQEPDLQTQAVKKTPKKKKRRRLWRLIILGVFIAVGAATFLWVRNNQSPAQGIIVPSTVPNDSSQAQETIQHETKYLSFSYPSRYGEMVKQVVKPPMLELMSIKYSQPAKTTYTISFTVKSPAGSPTATEDSAYVYRKQNPDLYKMSTEQINGQTYPKAVKKDGTEVTYFIAGPDKYAIVSGTTTNPGEPVDSEILVIMRSIKWL